MPPPPADGPPLLYLIDGHAQMFRAYHAIAAPGSGFRNSPRNDPRNSPRSGRSGSTSGGGGRSSMTSPVTGEPTNAVFAFTGMLLKLFDRHRPTHVAMAIDSDDRATFRHEIFPDYKANRSAPPDDFKPQIPRMLEVARLFGIPILEVPGDEADDIMATLADRLTDEHPDLKIRLVSKDKDLEQVLGDRVSLFDIHTDAELDVPGLLKKKGITPEQVVDYQTLTGDSTDNIPGVKGVGPKTAAKLINEFGSVDSLVDNIDKLKGKQKENVQAAVDAGDLDLTRRLVTLKRDSEIRLDIEDAAAGPIDAAALDELFVQLGFNRHRDDLRRLTSVATSSRGLRSEATKPRIPPEGDPEPGGLFNQSSDGEAGPELQNALLADPLGHVDGSYTCIRTADELAGVVAELKRQPIFAIDTETAGLGAGSGLCGVCLSWKVGEGVYIPTRSPEPDTHLGEAEVIEALRPVLEDASLPKVGHNIKYDWRVLQHAGVTMRGTAFDTMVAAFLTGSPGLGLDHLALAELGRTMIPITALIGEKPRKKADPPQKTMDRIPLDLATAYSAEDADVTLRLYELFRDRLDELEMTDLARRVEMPLVEVLATMETHGIAIDPDELERQRVQLQQRADELRQQILDAAQANFNPDSPKQLGELLFNQLHFPVQRRTKTGYSTDAEVLEKLASLTPQELEKVPDHAKPIPKLIVEYRMLTKLVGTYFGNLLEASGHGGAAEQEDCTSEAKGDGRIHASFHQTGAATGRLSSSNPNLQNIPIRTEVGRNIRRAFVAAPGHVLVSADYSQIELRILAHLSDDEALIEAFREGRDIHTAVAAQVFDVPLDDVSAEQRGHAKTINFGIVYGVTPFGLSRRIEGLDLEAATELIDSYKRTYAGIDRFLSRCVEQAVASGHVTTILGRRRWIDQVHSRNPQQRALGDRLAINSVVQGSAADLIKLAMVNLHRRLLSDASPAKMLLQIHDELVLECPAAEADAVSVVVVEEMEGAMALNVPLKADPGVGTNWFDAK